MRVVALDPSLHATGVADSSRAAPYLIVPGKGLVGMARLWSILKQVNVATEGADLTVVEGYALGAKGRSVFDIAELGGVIRLGLWTRNRPYVEVSPSTLKKLATGKGNAPKEAMLQASWQRLGYTGHDHNIADAEWLLQAALIHYDLPNAADLPKANREALAKVAWPTLKDLSRKKVA